MSGNIFIELVKIIFYFHFSYFHSHFFAAAAGMEGVKKCAYKLLNEHTQYAAAAVYAYSTLEMRIDNVFCVDFCC
jgi:hypothetical protein